jgi:hypothetical protein
VKRSSVTAVPACGTCEATGLSVDAERSVTLGTQERHAVLARTSLPHARSQTERKPFGRVGRTSPLRLAPRIYQLTRSSAIR